MVTEDNKDKIDYYEYLSKLMILGGFIIFLMTVQIGPQLVAIPATGIALLMSKKCEQIACSPKRIINLLKSYYKYTLPNSLILYTIIIGIIQIQIKPLVTSILSTAIKLMSYSMYSGLIFGVLIFLWDFVSAFFKEPKESSEDNLSLFLEFLLFFFSIHVICLGFALLTLSVPYIYWKILLS